MTLTIKELQTSSNIADLLSEQELNKVAHQVYTSYEDDEASRADWQDTLDRALKIAKQVEQTKSLPWRGSSNIKYPLISKAAIDYAARTYPTIIQGGKVVQGAVVGNDPDYTKAARAARVAKFMNFQLLQRDEGWEESFDKMLNVLPLVGTVFKKVYYDPILNKCISEFCNPDKIVVNHNSTSLEEAPQITHILELRKNQIVERMRAGLYRDVDLFKSPIDNEINTDPEDSHCPYTTLLEQHCYLDLDDDGYAEPYVVILHKKSREVLRIVSRFAKVESTEGRISYIEPICYFVDYHLIPSADGGFYSMGLGALLLPINAAINALLNQLIDAGTLNNTQGGFISRGLRVKNGEFQMPRGTYHVLDAAGPNIANHIFTLPTKEPSETLLKLLGLLIQAGKDLVSVNENTEGKGQTQNVSTGTLNMMLTQGLKVYNAISKRVYRSLKKELKKIYMLNSAYLPEAKYREILDDPQANKKADFATDLDILPVADPELSSMTQRLSKAQVVSQIPGVNPFEASKELLAALEIEEARIQQLLPPPDPAAPPPPEVQKIAAEIEKLSAEAKKILIEAEVLSEKQIHIAQEVETKRQDADTRTVEAQARIHKMGSDSDVNESKAALAQSKSAHAAEMDESKMMYNAQKDDVEMSIRATEVMNKQGPPK